MKKCLISVVVFVFVFAVSAPVFAAPLEKLKDGTVKVLTSPGQLVEGVKTEVDKSNNKLFGFVGGVFKGTFHTVEQAGHGVVDMVTFPVDHK